MGQKVHPTGIRLGISKGWASKWFSSSSDYSKNVFQDFKIREYLNKKLKDAAVSKIQIDRSSENVTVAIFSALSLIHISEPTRPERIAEDLLGE